MHTKLRKFLANTSDELGPITTIAEMSNEIVGTIQLPECWKNLVDTVFPHDLQDVRKARYYRDGIADPEPYYDDNRVVGTQLDNGDFFTVLLSSGQSNYWAMFDVRKGPEEIPVQESEPFFDFDEDEFEYDDGIVQIEWIPDDKF